MAKVKTLPKKVKRKPAKKKNPFYWGSAKTAISRRKKKQEAMYKKLME